MLAEAEFGRVLVRPLHTPCNLPQFKDSKILTRSFPVCVPRASRSRRLTRQRFGWAFRFQWTTESSFSGMVAVTPVRCPLPDFAGRGDWSVVELTEQHRARRYPGAERWAIFSDDGFGNPVGFDEFGRVWISDHDSCEFVCLESSFEDWVRRWALKIEPHRSGYIAQERWSDEILQRLRNGAA
jgi:hypothetical protein